jgi:hypothetical protein
LRAETIENQVYDQVNRTGVSGNGLEYEESSCVFSPIGEKIRGKLLGKSNIWVGI